MLAARAALNQHDGDVYVLFCDTPLLRPDTLTKIAGTLDGGANVVILGFEAADPTGYGRLITDSDGALLAIREDRDASDSERMIRLCNSGVMAFRCPNLLELLDQISDDNAKGEFYLTDIVEIARRHDLHCAIVTCPEDELLGINDRAQLAEAEAHYQNRLRAAAMADGRDSDCPGNGMVQPRHHVGSRRNYRAKRLLRSRRQYRGQRADTRKQSHRGRKHRCRIENRTVCSPAPGRQTG